VHKVFEQEHILLHAWFDEKKGVPYPYQQHSFLCLLETDFEMRSSFAADLRSKGTNAFFVKSYEKYHPFIRNF